MFKVTITNENLLGSPWVGKFETEELANEWLELQKLKVGRRPARVETVDGEDVNLEAEATYLIQDITSEVVVANIDAAIDGAINFGKGLWKKFSRENILLGINQAPIETLSAMYEATKGIGEVLDKGILSLAMAKLVAIPSEAKDEVFLTDSRILSYLNEIESFLDIPLSTEV